MGASLHLGTHDFDTTSQTALLSLMFKASKQDFGVIIVFGIQFTLKSSLRLYACLIIGLMCCPEHESARGKELAHFCSTM